MKILYVSGGDYSAVEFENARDAKKIDPKKLWDDSNQAGGALEYDEDEDFFEYRALEFGPVDPEFVKWVQSEQDYDAAKSANFYVIED